MKPRILFLGTACPFGDISGAGLRTLHLLEGLERLGTVTAVFASGTPWTPEQIQRTQSRFSVSLLTRYEPDPAANLRDRYRKVFDPRYLNTNGVRVPPADAERVFALAAEHDLVWVHTLKVANAFRRFHWPRSIADVDDFPSRFHRTALRHAPGPRAKLSRLQRAFSWRRHERLCLERFDRLVVCKEKDRHAFTDPSRVHVVPNGFAAPPALPPVENQGLRLGMIGDFNYLPNHDGLRWFMRHAWSSVQAAVPGVTLRLVGKGSEAIAREFSTRSVTGLGYVPDVGVEMASWSAMIVPTRLGGGTHLKVAEGLARRIPIVTTTHGARGYDLVAGTHALISDPPDAFATACIELLRHPARREALRAAGSEIFHARFSWASIFPRLEQVVTACLARSAR